MKLMVFIVFDAPVINLKVITLFPSLILVLKPYRDQETNMCTISGRFVSNLKYENAQTHLPPSTTISVPLINRPSSLAK
jgi:hypothetical protein